jgi:hypothetical protein
MTTTSAFQNKPDYFSSKEECIAESSYKKTQSNSRYKYFKQSIFHAGDEEQFQQFRDASNGNVCIPEISLNSNIYAEQHIREWDGYKNLKATAVLNTFRYMFNKFKKGIFVKIVNNELRVFLPFSKNNFVNEWGDRMQVNPYKYKKIENFFQHVSEMEGRRFNSKRVNSFPDTWYANNCLVRYEFPVSEGDSNVSTVQDMLKEMCARRKVPDIEFFVNRRDFPVLTRNGSEPYYNIWDSMEYPLVSHSYEQYSPIFSMSITDNYADMMFPTHEDWARVQSKESKFFARSCNSYNDIFNTPWQERKPTAVFRGGTTGCGVTIETNQRLKVSYISHITDTDVEGIPYLDAGVTNWNLRPRKLMGNIYLETIEKDNLPFSLATRISPEDQSKFKYIINIDGHVSAFRLSLELSMGSVILLVGSPWSIWYTDMLEPYKHYIPIQEDMSDLIDRIKWCRDNDDKCQQIALNARIFYDTYIQKEGILDYLQKTLVRVKNEIGVYLYNDISPLEYQIKQEYEELQNPWYPETRKISQDVTHIPPGMGRSYGLLQGIQWVVNMINTTDNFENYATEKELIFSNKLGTVREFNLAGFSFAVKTTSDSKKMEEHIHETYIGTTCINKLLKQIPNFAYIFGMYKINNSINVITERIEGESLVDYIKGPNFQFKEYIMILVQLSLAIQVAQNSCALVHYDLTPWNIIIQRFETPISFDYVLGYNNVFRVKSNIIPIIIDYGKSHVIHDNVHHGFINMYHVSTGHDILTLLITSLYQIITTQKLHPSKFKDLFILANYMTNTGFRQESFKNSKDLRDFLKNAKKYSNLISQNKYELEDKTPLDFLKYINKNFNKIYSLPFGIVRGTTMGKSLKLNKGNGRQVFEYILSATTEERIQTYADVFIRFKHCSIPQPGNLFFVYFTAQNLEVNLTSVRNNMLVFLEKENINNTIYEEMYKNVMKFLSSVYRPQLKEKKEEDINYFISESFSQLVHASYDESTFLVPEEILGKLTSYENNDLSDYKEIIEYILVNQGRYKLLEKDREYYIKNFSRLLQTDSIIMKNNNANIKTLRETAKSIYTRDLNKIQEKLEHVEYHDCESAKRYRDQYHSILLSID